MRHIEIRFRMYGCTIEEWDPRSREEFMRKTGFLVIPQDRWDFQSHTIADMVLYHAKATNDEIKNIVSIFTETHHSADCVEIVLDNPVLGKR